MLPPQGARTLNDLNALAACPRIRRGGRARCRPGNSARVAALLSSATRLCWPPPRPPARRAPPHWRAPPWPPSTPATRYFVQLLCPCTEAVDCLDSFSHSGSWCHCAAFQDQPWRTVDSRRCACCCARRAPSGTPRAGRARLRGQWRFARWGERRWATSAKRRHGKRPPSIHLTNNSPIFSRSRPLVSGRLK